jgi:hypothetical protein
MHMPAMLPLFRWPILFVNADQLRFRTSNLEVVFTNTTDTCANAHQNSVLCLLFTRLRFAVTAELMSPCQW